MVMKHNMTVSEACHTIQKDEGVMGYFRGWDATFTVSFNPAIQVLLTLPALLTCSMTGGAAAEYRVRPD